MLTIQVSQFANLVLIITSAPLPQQLDVRTLSTQTQCKQPVTILTICTIQQGMVEYFTAQKDFIESLESQSAPHVFLEKHVMLQAEQGQLLLLRCS